MKTLIKKVTIIDPKSHFNGLVKDILMGNGIIEKIEDNITDNVDRVYNHEGHFIMPSLIDSGVHYRDPGFESFESLHTMANQAINSGISQIVGFPNTDPIVQSKEALSFFKNNDEPVSFHNLAALTKNCTGEDFSEINDLMHHGAVGFSDGVKTLHNTDILYKSFLYAKALNTVIVTKPQDKYLAMYGQMHEGKMSTQLGLKGIPSIAEEIIIQRDLSLLEYAGVKHDKPILHFSTISTAKSVSLIREAKKAGLPVSCDIAAHQLVYLDLDLQDFNTDLKVNPPFRSKDDIMALKNGLADGTIDCIVSDHSPWSQEHKFLEFDMASFGIIGIETLVSLVYNYSGLTKEEIVQKLHYNPAYIYGLNGSTIKIGSKIEFSVFDFTNEFEYTLTASLSKNSPFIGQKMKGKCIGYFKGDFVKIQKIDA